MAENFEQTVRTRQVFYIPGYDPIHPRRYRELYRKEGAEQARISDYQIGLKPKTTKGNYGWRVTSHIDGADVDAQVEVLVWSDIVRISMSNSILATYRQLVQTAWVYIASGALWRLMQLRKGPVIAALYPVGMLLLQLLVAFVSGLLVYEAVTFFWGPPWFKGIAGALGVVTGWYILKWFKKKDGKFFAYYLMHDYAFGAATRGAYPPELETRIDEFGDAIAKALTSNVDEVLVVGHSSGAHLAVSILADLIRAGRVPQEGPTLAFLTLGQVVPMVSFLRDAHRLRADLRYLSQREEFCWVDVTAPGDGCAFALCDPVAVSGVAPEGKRWPLVFSAAFTQSLSPARWRALRWRFFRLHFQYLCAFDMPKDYDYFQITAGPHSLSERYAGRPASRSRVVKPVNKFTSTAP
tara:strand:+ start:686 stop:1912 length:1227 start_codon:yes stop_codon:yes gene_type:complete